MYGVDFYPTEKRTIKKLLEGIDYRSVNTILEPSAGDGAIVDYIKEKTTNINRYQMNSVTTDIDCVEIDENLSHILKGKSYKVVHNDFRTYNSMKAYDLIAMNPPFSEQEYHVKKALEMLLTSGGELRAITNAEMIKNPYSNIRKEIIQIINNNNGSIEFYQEEFSDAKRRTNVEIAIIKCKIEKREIGSIILKDLKQAELENGNTYENNYIVSNDFVKAIITQYDFECKAGITLIDEYNKLKSFTSSDFNKESSILKLRINSDNSCLEPNENKLKNQYLKEVRYKYWKALFDNKEFTKLFTANLKRDFYNKLSDLSNYDFTEFNINEIKNQLNQQVIKGVEETILELFDEFSAKHYWDKKDSSNIHYFNGWSTNKSWKINKKVITPINGYGMWNDTFDPTHYQCIDKLLDIEKVFNYLDSGKTEECSLREVLKQASEDGECKKIITKYFKIDFYKKGTTHLTFLDDELLKKFNIYGAMSKNFLPPSYSKKKYEDMTSKEKEVINSFEGKKEYEKVYKDKKYYLYNPNSVLMLT